MKPFLLLIAMLAGGVTTASAEDAGKVDAAIVAAFPNAPADWKPRFDQDATMKQCSASENAPSKTVADQIVQREKAKIEYPADGKLSGDWKSGEKIAQSGYGLRFTDIPARQPDGGNCYACHQLTKAEVSYGTVGPSLLDYGKLRNFSEADTKAVYEKIYNAQATYACSNMPRFGTNHVLTIDQIRDLVALVMSPDSPVNK
jgi:sulfur-oxidizing protein SoxX